MANGIADDLLTSTTLMFGSGIYICPAMHEEMYLNNTTQNNLKKLSQDNYIVGSRYGDLDIGDRGYGRLIEPIDLKNNIEKTLGKHRKSIGKAVKKAPEKHCKNTGKHRKTFEMQRKRVGKALEKYWKSIGKAKENHWKSIGTALEKNWASIVGK